jgi:hypothetical protein
MIGRDFDDGNLMNVKTYLKNINDPRLARLEAAKTAAAHHLAKRSGLFITPALISATDSTIETEYIEGLSRYRVALSGINEAAMRKTLVERVGRTLGTIHKHLDCPNIVDATKPDVFRRIDMVQVHGDFGGANVMVKMSTLEVVVIDWAPPAWRVNLSPIASSHWDIGLFLVDLNYQRPGDPVYVSGLSALNRAFLNAYAQIRPINLPELRRSVLIITLYYYRMARYFWTSLARLPSSLYLLARNNYPFSP